MRIVTWNCCRGPAHMKLARLAHLLADVAVVQECGPKTSTSDTLWFGDNPRQGIAVTVSNGYSLAPLLARDTPRFAVPVFVQGPQSFQLLAIWSQRQSFYVEGIIKAVQAYADFLVTQPTIILGDFNSNVVWDQMHAETLNHSYLVKYLGDLDLVSAYHHFHLEAQGSESRPILYFQWQHSRPYHIDYCFIPRAWASHLVAVEVGSYHEWADVSDHRPLIVDLNLPVEL